MWVANKVSYHRRKKSINDDGCLMEMAAVGVETAAAVVTVASIAAITAVFVTEVCCDGVSCGGISSGSCSGSGGGSGDRADHYHQPYLMYSHSDSCLCSNGDRHGGGSDDGCGSDGGCRLVVVVVVLAVMAVDMVLLLFAVFLVLS